MNKEENQLNGESGEKGERVEVACNERTSKILQNILIPNMKKDAFCRIAMNAVASSGKRGMPVNVTISGNNMEGRCCFVTNSLCCMAIMELTVFGKGDGLKGCIMGNIASYDEAGDRIEDEEYGQTRILQLSIGSPAMMSFASAMIGSAAPLYSDGCGLVTDRDLSDEDKEDLASEGEDLVDAPDPEETDEPIPFPTPA